MWLESQKESEVSVEEWFSEMTLRLASFALDWKYGGRRIASHSEWYWIKSTVFWLDVEITANCEWMF